MAGGSGERNPRKPGCSLCGRKRRLVRPWQKVVGLPEGADPDYAVRICDACDVPLPEESGGQ